MRRLSGSLIKAAALAALAVYSMTSASAATCAAPGGPLPSIANNVSPNSGCSLGSTNNDTLGGGVLQVNTDGLFGGDWRFIDRDLSEDFGVDSTLRLVAEPGFAVTRRGNYRVDLNGTAFNEALLVFKDGDGFPSTYVGYFLSAALIGFDKILVGAYLTPFRNLNGTLKDISHATLYGRVSAVPLPAALPLFLTALGGLGLLGWRVARLRPPEQSLAPAASGTLRVVYLGRSTSGPNLRTC